MRLFFLLIFFIPSTLFAEKTHPESKAPVVIDLTDSNQAIQTADPALYQAMERLGIPYGQIRMDLIRKKFGRAAFRSFRETLLNFPVEEAKRLQCAMREASCVSSESSKKEERALVNYWDTLGSRPLRASESKELLTSLAQEYADLFSQIMQMEEKYFSVKKGDTTMSPQLLDNTREALRAIRETAVFTIQKAVLVAYKTGPVGSSQDVKPLRTSRWIIAAALIPYAAMVAAIVYSAINYPPQALLPVGGGAWGAILLLRYFKYEELISVFGATDLAHKRLGLFFDEIEAQIKTNPSIAKNFKITSGGFASRVRGLINEIEKRLGPLDACVSLLGSKGPELN